MATSTDLAKIKRGAVSQLGLLVAQYLAGMAVNVIGLPEEATEGLPRIASQALLGLHVVIAIGLIGGAIGLSLRLHRQDDSLRKWGHYGGAGTGLAFIFGGLALSPFQPELWSYLMSVAFLVAAASYTMLLVRVTRR